VLTLLLAASVTNTTFAATNPPLQQHPPPSQLAPATLFHLCVCAADCHLLPLASHQAPPQPSATAISPFHAQPAQISPHVYAWKR